MKKYLLMLLAVLPLALFTACSDDDDDLPRVDFDLTIEGATDVDGTLYLVRGQTLTIASITVINKEAGKAAFITAANYYWDGYYLGYSVQPPYGFEIQTTEDTGLGRHLLEIRAPLFAVDKELANALLQYRVQVVASEDEVPDGGNSTIRVTPSITDHDDD